MLDFEGGCGVKRANFYRADYTGGTKGGERLFLYQLESIRDVDGGCKFLKYWSLVNYSEIHAKIGFRKYLSEKRVQNIFEYPWSQK